MCENGPKGPTATFRESDLPNAFVLEERQPVRDAENNRAHTKANGFAPNDQVEKLFEGARVLKLKAINLMYGLETRKALESPAPFLGCSLKFC